MTTPMTYEVWASTQNTKMKRRLKTKDRAKADKKLAQFYKSLPRFKGEITLIGNKERIMTFWWGYYGEIEGRHYASHEAYNIGSKT